MRSDVDPDAIGLRVVAMIQGLENQWLHARDEIDLACVFGDWVVELKASLAFSR